MRFSKQAKMTGPVRACRRPYPRPTTPARAPAADTDGQSVHTNAAQYPQTQRLTDPTDREANKQTKRLTDRQTDKQTNRPTNIVTD